MTRWVYSFGNGSAEGHAGLTDLGGKGANLAAMSALGLPVPPGFTITTQACAFYHANNKTFPPGLKGQVAEAMTRLGHLGDPLLVAVRSGAPVSMPGMMDTILNLGLTDHTVAALAQRTGDAGFADDCYRRLKQMYADAMPDAPLPQDPQAQLWGAIGAVLESWNSPRAIAYRAMFNIADAPGTAVTVQAMVFGNRGEGSASGVCFTRDPATGEKILNGEYLAGAQGEDIVSGRRTPRPLSEMAQAMPGAFAQLSAIAAKLESHFRDMQDVEFTVEQGTLYILQTRDGKRSANAMLKIAVEMVSEGLIDERAAVARIDVDALGPLLGSRLDPATATPPLFTGLGASPGAAVGEIVFTAEEAINAQPRDVILVREEASPTDFPGMKASRGMLTARGGRTSHAALVARQMGIAFVTGAHALTIDAANGKIIAGDVALTRGDVITIDGESGKVFRGRLPLQSPHRNDDFDKLLIWADKILSMAAIAAERGRETHDARNGSGIDSRSDQNESLFMRMSLSRLRAAQAALTQTPKK